MHTDSTGTLVAEAARRLSQHAPLERLVSISAQQLRDTEPRYARIAEKSLTDQMRKTLRLTLTRISREPIPPELANAAYETGQLRAVQQVDVNAVSRSFRIDLRVLWEAFLQDAEEHGLSAHSSYYVELVHVWEAVETNIIEMSEGYRATTEMMRRQNNELRNAAFWRLLDADSEAGVAKELTALAFDATRGVTCIVSTADESDSALVSAVQGKLALKQIPSFFGRDRRHLLGLAQASAATFDDVREALSELEDAHTALVVARTPAHVLRAFRSARDLVEAASGPGIRTLREDWLTAVSAADSVLSASLADDVFGGFDNISDYARSELARIIEGFFSTNGTVLAISKVTFRHRNTVSNRLHQIEALTGLDLSTPRDIALLAVAFEAWRRRRTATATVPATAVVQGPNRSKPLAGLPRL